MIIRYRNYALLGLGVVTLIVLPPVLSGSAYLSDLLINVFLWSGLALSWNLAAGFAGRFSIGHVGFFGIGAYTSTLLFMKLGISPWIGLLVGMVLAAMVAMMLELVTARQPPLMFAMTGFALAELLNLAARGWVSLTEGTVGLSIPPRSSVAAMIFKDNLGYAWTTAGYLLLVLVVGYVVTRSRHGYFLLALRDDEVAASASGVPVTLYKLSITGLSAALTAAGGTLYAQYMLFVDPDSVFSIRISIEFALGSILGGLGTLTGPIVGASAMVLAQRFLLASLGSNFIGLYFLVYGPLLIIVVLFWPDGFVPFVAHRWRQWRGRVAASAVGGVKSQWKSPTS